MSGWADHIEPIKGTRRRMGRTQTRQCQSQGPWNVGVFDGSLHEAWRHGAIPSTGRAVLARKSDGAVYRISAAMLTAMHSVDSLSPCHATCA